jgi:hypothetical protein
MSSRNFTAFLFAASVLMGAPLDRIEAVVDHQVITELNLEEDIRVTDFLNGTTFDSAVAPAIEQRRAAAQRLIDQALIKQEMALSHFPSVEEAAVDQAIEQLRQTRGPTGFDAGLERNQISLTALRRHLGLQLTTARFVAFRFRPELGISDNDLEDYYHRVASKWQAEHPNEPLPGFEASRTIIRQALIEERTNQALDEWLRDARQRAQIDIVDPALQVAK